MFINSVIPHDMTFYKSSDHATVRFSSSHYPRCVSRLLLLLVLIFVLVLFLLFLLFLFSLFLLFLLFLFLFLFLFFLFLFFLFLFSTSCLIRLSRWLHHCFSHFILYSTLLYSTLLYSTLLYSTLVITISPRYDNSSQSLTTIYHILSLLFSSVLL